MRSMSSPDPDTILVPVGAKATDQTESVCPSSTYMPSPVDRPKP